jgi:transcriptional regulator with GAF, ATPase, and Fis domain
VAGKRPRTAERDRAVGDRLRRRGIQDRRELAVRGQAIETRLALSSTLAAQEKAIIEEALRASGGRVFGPAGAAQRLGMPRSTLESRIRTLQIDKVHFRARAPGDS